MELYYYNTKNGKCFAKDVIDPADMPDSTVNVSDWHISNQEISDTVKNRLF